MENKNEDNKGLVVFIIVMVFAGTFFMGLIQKCTGSKYNPIEDGSPWQPRHTHIQKPIQNIVKDCGFNAILFADIA